MEINFMLVVVTLTSNMLKINNMLKIKANLKMIKCIIS